MDGSKVVISNHFPFVQIWNYRNHPIDSPKLLRLVLWSFGVTPVEVSWKFTTVSQKIGSIKRKQCKMDHFKESVDVQGGPSCKCEYNPYRLPYKWVNWGYFTPKSVEFSGTLLITGDFGATLFSVGKKAPFSLPSHFTLRCVYDIYIYIYRKRENTC